MTHSFLPYFLTVSTCATWVSWTFHPLSHFFSFTAIFLFSFVELNTWFRDKYMTLVTIEVAALIFALVSWNSFQFFFHRNWIILYFLWFTGCSFLQQILIRMDTVRYFKTYLSMVIVSLAGHLPVKPVLFFSCK